MKKSTMQDFAAEIGPQLHPEFALEKMGALITMKDEPPHVVVVAFVGELAEIITGSFERDRGDGPDTTAAAYAMGARLRSLLQGPRRPGVLRAAVLEYGEAYGVDFARDDAGKLAPVAGKPPGSPRK